MYRLLILILASFFLMGPLVAQDDIEDVDTDEEGEVAEDVTAEEEEPEFDESGLDEQGFENQDDDFQPTEEIPTDQSIEFPTDI